MLKNFIKENLKDEKEKSKKSNSDEKGLFFYKDGDFEVKVFRSNKLIKTNNK